MATLPLEEEAARFVGIVRSEPRRYWAKAFATTNPKAAPRLALLLRRRRDSLENVIRAFLDDTSV